MKNFWLNALIGYLVVYIIAAVIILLNSGLYPIAHNCLLNVVPSLFFLVIYLISFFLLVKRAKQSFLVVFSAFLPQLIALDFPLIRYQLYVGPKFYFNLDILKLDAAVGLNLFAIVGLLLIFLASRKPARNRNISKSVGFEVKK